jgi:O-antigen ligase
MGKIASILFHINLTVIISFNLITYSLSQIGLRFSVAYAVIFFVFSFLYMLITGGVKVLKYNRISLLMIFIGLLLLNVLFFQVEYGIIKFQLFIARMFLGVLILQCFFNLGYRINTHFLMALGVAISSVLLFQASQTNFLLRTSMIIDLNEKSRVITGVIEDSRSLLFILICIILRFKHSLIYYLAIVFILAGIFVTQTRQTVLILAILILPYIIYNSWRNIEIRKLRNRVILTFTALLIYLYSKIESLNLGRFAEVNETLANYNDRDSRGGMIEWAFDLFLDKPLFGWGFGYTDQTYSYPHNIILELLAELGFVGFLVFAVYFLFNYFSIIDKRLKLLVRAFFILSLVSGNLMQNYFLFLALSLDQRFLESMKVSVNKL